MSKKPDCDTCEEMYEGKTKARCDACHLDLNIPDILEENIPIFQIWTRVNRQLVMGSGGPVALNLIPVFTVLDMFKIDEDEKTRCLDLLQLLYHKVFYPLYLESKKEQE